MFNLLNSYVFFLLYRFCVHQYFVIHFYFGSQPNIKKEWKKKKQTNKNEQAKSH